MDTKKSFEMLVKMRPRDYLPIPYVAEMLGADEGEIRRLIRTEGMETMPLSRRDPQRPKDKGLQFVDSKVPYYVFRDGIRDLVKMLDTKEACAIFDHLLDTTLFRKK
jgi:hypothetical protein